MINNECLNSLENVTLYIGTQSEQVNFEKLFEYPSLSEVKYSIFEFTRFMACTKICFWIRQEFTGFVFLPLVKMSYYYWLKVNNVMKIFMKNA